MKLSKENIFEYNSNELLGVMRFDFYDRSLANKWNPKEALMELNNKNRVDINKLQKELNCIQFELIGNFNKVVELCKGIGYENETLVYIEFEEGKYVIKLIPVLDCYSYIYAYKRDI